MSTLRDDIVAMKETLTQNRTTCVTCGSLCGVYCGKEGTSSYVPLDAATIANLIAFAEEAEKALEFYASLAMPKGSHPCDIDVRFQIDGGSDARDVLSKYFGGGK